MISADFAPNEDRSDAMKSLSVGAGPHTWLTGPAPAQAASEIATLFPKHHVTMFLTARAALYSYLNGLNLPKGSEILVTGFTCKAVIIPILALHLKPVFVDIDTDTYSMNPQELKKNISKTSRLIILQHTFGIPPHRKEILAIAKKAGVPVLEDLAHGFDERLFRTDEYQTDKLLSFGRTKVMSSLWGGAIATPNHDLHKILLEIERTLPYPSKTFIFNSLMYKPLNVFMRDTYDIGIGKFAHFATNTVRLFPKEVSPKENHLGFDRYVLKRYPNALAELLLHQLRKFHAMQDTRRKNATIYGDAQGIPLKDLPLNRFPILVKNQDEVYKSLVKKGIYLGRWYREVLPPAGTCPVTEHVSAHILNLPTLVSTKDAEQIVNALDSTL